MKNNIIKHHALILCLLSLSSCNQPNEFNSDDLSIQDTSSVIDEFNSNDLSIQDTSSIIDDSSINEQPTSETISNEPSVSYIENPFVEEPLNDGYMEIRKHIYQQANTIRIYPHNCKPKDWVGIYSKNSEPFEEAATIWEYVGNKELIEFNASKLSVGEYNVFLCENDGYIVLDKEIIKIIDDTTDYCVNNATYTISNTNGVNTTTVTIYPSSTKELTYSLYWSIQGETLEQYTPLKTVKSKGQDSFSVTLNECIYMPDEATGIEVYVEEGLSSSFYIEMDNSLKLPKSNYLYNFQVFTDLHIDEYFINFHSHLNTALKEVLQFAGNSEAIFTVGDHTNYGSESNYNTLSNLINKVFTDDIVAPKIYYSLGNHEYMYHTSFETAVELFKKHTGLENVYYSVEIQGNKFIVLGSDSIKGEGTMNDEQISWLKNELSNTNVYEPTFIFIHQPLYNTVSGSLNGQGWDGMRSEAEALKNILNDYPNAIVFSGHTHWTLDSKQPALYGKGTSASYINGASVGYLWNDNNADEPGSEGLFIEVYEDYILIKGREFVDRKWVSAAHLVFPLVKQSK